MYSQACGELVQLAKPFRSLGPIVLIPLCELDQIRPNLPVSRNHEKTDIFNQFSLRDLIFLIQVRIEDNLEQRNRPAQDVVSSNMM